LIRCPVHYCAPAGIFPRLREDLPGDFNVFRVNASKRLIDEHGATGLEFLD
jgi:hypothetical protein